MNSSLRYILHQEAKYSHLNRDIQWVQQGDHFEWKKEEFWTGKYFLSWIEKA